MKRIGLLALVAATLAGIATTAFLLTGGVPGVVELAVSLDVLLIVLVLQVLTARVGLAFGGTDIDELRDLHD